jgi:hypothetical protein
MTLFCGALALKRGKELPQGLIASLSAHLRSPKAAAFGETRQHAAPGFFITGWDSGAFAEPAWRARDSGAFAALTGNPLLVQEGHVPSRGIQLDALAAQGRIAETAKLAQTRGSFALAAYDPDGATLKLATDMVGLRPIYYVVLDDVLVFATALRILEAMPEVPKQLSKQGFVELSACRYPLGNRTPYQGIHLLREAQMLRIANGELVLGSYFDWHEEAVDAPDMEAAARLIDAEFTEAVRLRAGQDERVYSFLSGGMDSRAIVAVLARMGKQIEALNFSPDGSQDQIFAKRLVEQMNGQCRLHCATRQPFPNFSLLAHAAKTALEQREPLNVDRPQMIWSGDGGSVGLGHIYMDEPMLDLAEQQGIEAALVHFRQYNRIGIPSVGILEPGVRDELSAELDRGLLEEFKRFPRADVGKQIYLFLMFNGQRRLLFKHLETVDQHGLELLTPFYDAALLRLIANLPARWGILHRVYAKWFELLPEFARRTPWQTYPGHVPCPVPNPDADALYQWANRFKPYKAGPVARARMAGQMISMLPLRSRPKLFSRSRVGTAALLHALGLRDCRHVHSMLQTYRSLAL